MLREIETRRSIRKFSDQEIPMEDIQYILESGIKAPSAKNRQPWKFVIVMGKEKEGMLEAFRRGIEREEKREALLPESQQFLSGAKYTAQIMEQAPVSVFVLNSLGKGLFSSMNEEERIFEVCNIQSVSAAIQNMLLAAEHKGIGSLWIYDIFFAYEELCQWLGTEGELLAAVSFGYPNEAPKPRPRKELDKVVVWKDGGLKR
ncbi:nitroreductase family protein [Blautia hydrogenotrophica]|uniref:Nitroreductase domain-containing protein n=1 Tax=Blautia hydrogenotrophica (strain DSM 10507 / JCM 14656 / S5a33) TaxID=476272 RepID=C0CRP2_BLAHS|nr:nitroreductase family protein [Blautia hydrogenotrophica]EEG47564.1 nitroreductase family protein [Blautia hydrogenotrophica DSM 10507]MCT6797759.1 nitroreductase family protein [Blautia hydrogenotrophica]WPX85280.1 Putative NAD(P)H nitroreductase YfkO [Blautia hydrogenotrophica DSM 10507]